MAKCLPNLESSIATAAEALAKGELVAIPTETVYGLAGDATNSQAVAKIFSAKERPSFDPLIVHIPHTANPWDWMTQKKLVDLTSISKPDFEMIQSLTNAFWPGPLTLVLPKGESIPDLVTSGLPRVGIRMPDHPLTQALLLKCDLPLAAPSANRFGRISPTHAQAVQEELGDRIEFILDGGPSRVGIESTVVLFDENLSTFQILRPGGVSKEAIDEVLSIQGKRLSQPPASHSVHASPGMLESHYAPKKPAFRIARVKNARTTGWEDSQIESFKKKWKSVSILTPELLSASGNDEEAAAKLFSTLRALDSNPSIAAILVVLPEQDFGLWPAIRDRLTRATAEWKSD